jgi:prevent-host-death family protein
VLSTNEKGAIAEAAIALEATRLGIEICRPSLHARYDLVFDTGDALLRVQCKWASVEAETVMIRASGSWYSPGRGYVRSRYSSHEIDAIAAYCAELDQCYYVPIERLDGQRSFQLRLRPAKNGQVAAIHFEADFRLGAVAQLARASGWQPEGRGFESPQLHSSDEPMRTVVGAHEFRNRFGWYMERAAAGEEIAVTYRGRPRARLLPPAEPEPRPEAPQLELVRSES